MNWYLSNEGHAEGPLPEGRLAELARAGTVGTDTLIWHPGLEEWEPVWKLKPDLVEHLNRGAMAAQAKGTTDRVPLMQTAATAETAKGAPEGVFKRLLGRLKKK